MIPELSTPAAEKETSRVEAFSDGIFAIAITLLVLNLKVPDPHSISPLSASALVQVLSHQWPAYLALATSFATILIMWVNHHYLFKLVRRADTLFLFANGFLLMLVTIVPFPTALVAEYLETPAASVACAIYAGFFVLINLSYNLLWFAAAHHHRLLKPTVSTTQIRTLTRNYWLGVPLYLAATLLAFWHAEVSAGICSGLWIFWACTAYERRPVYT